MHTIQRKADCSEESEHDVLSLLHLGHPNLLLVGAESLTGTIVNRLSTCLALPLHTCEVPGRFALPTEQVGTLLIRHVDRLGDEEQDQLFRWLDTNGGYVQVVAVSSTRLFDQVESGAFDERLYYRLNTVLENVERTLSTSSS
jgi:hypothetical protein